MLTALIVTVATRYMYKNSLQEWLCLPEARSTLGAPVDNASADPAWLAADGSLRAVYECSSSGPADKVHPPLRSKALPRLCRLPRIVSPDI